MFDAKTEALLKRAENSDDPDLQAKADESASACRQAWRTKRDQELDSADKIMIDRYRRASSWPSATTCPNPAYCARFVASPS
jgi:hypothetical protein